MPNPERTIADFIEDTQRARLPIEPEDTRGFAEAIQSYNPPEGWLGRVLSSLQYIDEETFERDLESLAQQSVSFLSNKPYAAILSYRDKSDYWIYTALQRRGLPPAAMIYDSAILVEEERIQLSELEQAVTNNPHLTVQEIMQLTSKPSPFRRWMSRVPQDFLICAFDDFSISGSVIRADLFGIPNKGSLQPDRYHAFFCYATQVALGHLREFAIVPHQSGQSIRTLKDFVTAEDMVFIDRLVIETSGEDLEVGNESAVLFWTWYKVPDNVPSIFTGVGFPPLIRTERFQPPYKNMPSQ